MSWHILKNELNHKDTKVTKKREKQVVSVSSTQFTDRERLSEIIMTELKAVYFLLCYQFCFPL